jgi:hypothetical protein
MPGTPPSDILTAVPTDEAARMAEVVNANAGLLREAGFKKRRHCFNRKTDAGLVHVVYFWQHPKEPPAWTEVPGLRERRYGTFRLDFGVYVPEMTRSGTPRGDWVNEYNCDLRRTIGELIGGDEAGDWWWPLSDANAETVARSALVEHGLPWLDQFSDHDAVLRGFRLGGPFAIGMSPAGPLDVAQMLDTLGRHDEARTVLEAYVSQPVHQSHAYYLADYLPGIGHADLVSRVQVRDGQD